MIRPPVEPAQQLLPLNDVAFEWDKFEGFCADFIYKLPYVKDCHRHGKKGNKQDGIDIIAELEEGGSAAFSCKQYNDFKISDAKKAVRALTYHADEYYLLLSCEAGVRIRKEWCKNGPNWFVWDKYDISRKIRELPLDSARSLIITYFGNDWVEYFLKIKGLSAFVSPKEFFAKLMKPNNLFTHIYSLVGRKDLLQQLNLFIKSEEHNIAMISGRGGVGKTKFLQSFSESFHELHKNKILLFVEDGIPITIECINDLPNEPCVVVLDDAHRCQDLSILFAAARKRSIKLLLSFRPYALERIRSLLICSKFDINEICDLGKLKNLDRKEIKELALDVLGDEKAYLADQLVAVGWDSPLVIVVGGRLLVEKKMNPQFLIHQKDFKAAVLDKFQEFLLGKVTDQIDPKLCRNILELIAAITPVRINDLRDEAAAFLGVAPSDLICALNILEISGIIQLRGYTLRIVPDVLSDHILYRACITPEGKTGFAQKVFENLKIVCSSNILNNLAELDWRARGAGDTQIDLFADIWSSINYDFQNSSNLGRWFLLNKLGNVAYLQPARMLSMVEYAIRNPSDIVDDGKIIKYTHDKVMHKLPDILKNIGHNLDYLPRCCDLLWQMGSDDQRNLNQYPEHPIRILKELAEYDVNKPYIFNKIVLNAMTALLKAPDIHNHFHSIFDILEPLLAKSGNSVHAEGMKIVFTPFLVERTAVQPIRERVLNLIKDSINQDDTKATLKAIKYLRNAINEPFNFKGLEISEEVLDQWVPEQLHVLEILRRLADCAKDSLVHMEIIDAIGWQAHWGRSKDVKENAQEIITSIKENFEFRLTRVLKNSYLHQKHFERHKDHRKWIEEENCDLAKKFLEIYSDPFQGFVNLNQRLQTIKNSGIVPQPEQFLIQLSYINQHYAKSLCELIIKNPNCSIAPFFHNILYKIRYKDMSCSSDLVLRAINTGNLILCCSAAYIYQIWTGCPIFQCDFENIKKLLTHQDIIVRMNAIRSLGVMAHLERQIGTEMDFSAVICDENDEIKNPKIAFSVSTNIRKISVDSLNILALSDKRIGIDIALDVNVGDDTELADTLCSIFDEKRGIPIGDLTDEQLNFLIKKIELVKDIDRYHISGMLRKASGRIPHSIVHLLLNRIRFDLNYSENYLPLPYLGFHESIFIDSSNSIIYKDLLKEIRSFALENKNNFWISILFKDISGNFSDMGLEVLNEWVSTDDPNKVMSVGDLLRHASADFIFSHTNFISNLLDHSYHAGNECHNYIGHILSNIAISGGSPRTRGEPSPKEVDLRDRASEALKQFEVGSPAYKYYDSIRKDAELSITHDLKMDEEILD